MNNRMSVVIDNLIISSQYEMRYNPEVNRNVVLIVNAAIEVVHQPIRDVSIVNLNWDDSTYQYINKHSILFKMVKLIDEFLKRGDKVVVNCYAGVSRSATIVCAYLMYKYRISLEKSLEFLKIKREIVNPNQGFMIQLKVLEPILHSLNTSAVQSSNNFDNFVDTSNEE